MVERSGGGRRERGGVGGGGGGGGGGDERALAHLHKVNYFSEHRARRGVDEGLLSIYALSAIQLDILFGISISIKEKRRVSAEEPTTTTAMDVNNNQMAIGQSGLVLLDQDMAGLPLPDLVSSAIRQFQQAPAPRVTTTKKSDFIKKKEYENENLHSE
ncbi:hypothetical protein M0802_013181 [Mischocyttarus mexicanus]|nr:hypothetical protein M0802_013181 [Mischocyttarus mexicanus]